MSFLQINSANPSVKRPFRLSDIQDIWEGLNSMFTSTAPLIVSGFIPTDDDPISYGSGVVCYNGQLYYYDEDECGTISDESDVIFARVIRNDRTLEGGTIQPFSFEYVCGTSLSQITSFFGTVASSFTVTNFGRHIEEYRAYIGNRAITERNLAPKSVTTEKLAYKARTTPIGSSEILSTDFETLLQAYDSELGLTRQVRISASSQWEMFVQMSLGISDDDLPTSIPVLFRNPTAYNGVIQFKRGGSTVAIVTLAAGKSIVLRFTKISGQGYIVENVEMSNIG